MSIADDIKVYHNPADDLSEKPYKCHRHEIEPKNLTATEIMERQRTVLNSRIDIEAYTKLLEKATARIFGAPVSRDTPDTPDTLDTDDYDDPMPVNYVETDHTVKPIIPVDYARIEKRIEEYVRSKQATITDMLYRGGKPGEPYDTAPVTKYLDDVARIVEQAMGMPAHTLTLVEKKKPRTWPVWGES